MHRYRVDRKVPAREVLDQIVGKGDRLRCTMMDVVLFDAVGRHFDGHRIKAQRQRSMTDAGGDDTTLTGKNRTYLLRKCVGCDIIIMNRAPKQPVAYTATDQKRFIVLLVQGLDDVAYSCGQPQRTVCFHTIII